MHATRVPRYGASYSLTLTPIPNGTRSARSPHMVRDYIAASESVSTYEYSIIRWSISCVQLYL